MRRLPVPLWFFELSPAVTVSVKGARKKEDKDKGTPAYAEVNLAAQGAVGIFLGGGVPKLAEVYGGAELSLELAVTYKSICDKHEECGFSLAGGLALKGALKAGVTLGAVDVSYKLGEAELIKIQLGHLCSEGLEGADFELGKDPKAVIDTINEVIDNAGEIVENLGGFLTGEDPLEAAKNFIKCNQAVQEEIGTRAKAEKEFFKSLGLSSPWVNNVAYVYAWRDALDDYKRDIEKSAVSRALLPRWRAVAAEFESLCYAISEGASGDFSGVMREILVRCHRAADHRRDGCRSRSHVLALCPCRIEPCAAGLTASTLTLATRARIRNHGHVTMRTLAQFEFVWELLRNSPGLRTHRP